MKGFKQRVVGLSLWRSNDFVPTVIPSCYLRRLADLSSMNSFHVLEIQTASQKTRKMGRRVPRRPLLVQVRRLFPATHILPMHPLMAPQPHPRQP